ncbi:AP-3 complex subunit delta-1, partial [Ophiophagus hannah]
MKGRKTRKEGKKEGRKSEEEEKEKRKEGEWRRLREGERKKEGRKEEGGREGGKEGRTDPGTLINTGSPQLTTTAEPKVYVAKESGFSVDLAGHKVAKRGSREPVAPKISWERTGSGRSRYFLFLPH